MTHVVSGVGQNAEKIRNAMIERGRPVPEHLQNEPTPLPQFYLYWRGFADLTTTRHNDGPIPWTAVADYCSFYEIDDAEMFLSIIKRLDSHLRGLWKQKAEESRQ